ncbi:MAG: ABC transporter ATP-binding protein, partial [Muribaculaceae bacterium]
QKVQFIITVLHNPRLLIFDEPFSGFDPINANVLKREILKLRDAGATVIFSTHNMGSVEELCDEITLINKSHNILSGPVHTLRQQFSDNNYEFVIASDPAALTTALEPLVKDVVSTVTERDGSAKVSVHLRSADDLRDVISAANAASLLRSFRQVLPSMDDIFIRTVEASNAVADVPPVYIPDNQSSHSNAN